MIDLLARKCRFGEISINKAKQHLSRHEWGLARLALDEAVNKGGLKDQQEVERLLDEIRRRLWSKPD